MSACLEMLSHLVGSASTESIGPGHDGGKCPDAFTGMEIAAGLAGLDDFLTDFAVAVYMRDHMAARAVELELRRRNPKLDARVIQAAWAAYLHPLPVDENGRTVRDEGVLVRQVFGWTQGEWANWKDGYRDVLASLHRADVAVCGHFGHKIGRG
jgi:hypothetical protein